MCDKFFLAYGHMSITLLVVGSIQAIDLRPRASSEDNSGKGIGRKR